MCSMWVAWTLSRWPDSNYLYISYSKSLAAKHTEFIRRIIQNKLYSDLFEVRIRDDSKSKRFFFKQCRVALLKRSERLARLPGKMLVFQTKTGLPVQSSSTMRTNRMKCTQTLSESPSSQTIEKLLSSDLAAPTCQFCSLVSDFMKMTLQPFD